jgi:hypothetical protein
MSISRTFQSLPKRLPAYGVLYLDHLRGEFALARPRISDKQDMDRLAEIEQRRVAGAGDVLTWNDVHVFGLLLLKYLNTDELRVRIQTLRPLFRSIAGQKDYDSYLTSKPPEFDQTPSQDELVRDAEYLHNEFCLRYAFTAARERLRNLVLWVGFGLTLLFVGAFTLVIYLHLSGRFGKPGINTISVVLFAGIVGGFMSVLQRVQSASSEGDPVFNYSSFWHGWPAILLSPLTGGIFAVLLYGMFTSGLLQGTIFPDISTIRKEEKTRISGVEESAAPTEAPTATVPTEAPTPTPSPSPSPTPNQSQSERSAVGFKEVIDSTGPRTGVDFALLLIWAFIAGFAERFVPDTLSRLVSRAEKEKENAS